ncbi:MAG: arylsulfatase, partial [Armatimonadetes bacterium]|nr:arylsulfatase [Armatimonadota bacterium]
GIDYFAGKLPLLFNLEEDPGENWDRSEQYPDLVQELLDIAAAHSERVAYEGTFLDDPS